MLKKIFVTALLMVMTFILSSNICNAIPEREMYLGGLTCFDPFVARFNTSKVRSIYGEPTSIEKNALSYSLDSDSNVEYADIWRYGNSVEILFFEGYIVAIKVSANNGWKTPSGLAVGMKLEDAEKMYGKLVLPNSKIFGNKGVGYYHGDIIPDQIFGIVFDKTSHKILKLCICGYGYPYVGGDALDGMIKWLLK